MNKKFIFLILGILVISFASAGIFSDSFGKMESLITGKVITGNAIGSDGWTAWFDRDNPSGNGDYETLSSLLKERPNDVCENPTAIECQTKTGEDYASTGQNVICKEDYGLVCRNADNGGGLFSYTCKDYRVRFYCGNEIVETNPTSYCEGEDCTLYFGSTAEWNSNEIYIDFMTDSVVILNVGGTKIGQLIEGSTWEMTNGIKIEVSEIGYTSSESGDGFVKIQISQSTTPLGNCTDSDGGFNIYVKGYSEDSTGFKWEDYCTDRGNIAEATCKYGTTAISSKEACPVGYACSDGACVKNTTTPSTEVTYQGVLNMLGDANLESKIIRSGDSVSCDEVCTPQDKTCIFGAHLTSQTGDSQTELIGCSTYQSLWFPQDNELETLLCMCATVPN